MSKRKAPNDKRLKALYLDKKMSSGEIAKKYKNTSLYYFPSQPFQLDIINPSHLDDMLQVRKAL